VTIDDVIAIFEENGLDVDRKMKVAGLLCYSKNHIDAELWMEKYFFKFEHQPNSTQIHLDSTWKREIYLQYVDDVSKIEGSEPLSE